MIDGDSALLDEFCDHLWLEDGLSKNTLEAYRRDLALFGDWLARERSRGLLETREEDLSAYFAFRYNKARLRASSQARLHSSLKRFFQYALRENKARGRSHAQAGHAEKTAALSQVADRSGRGGAARRARRGGRPGPARPRHAGDALRHRAARVRAGGAEADRDQPGHGRGARVRQGRQGAHGADGRGGIGLAHALPEGWAAAAARGARSPTRRSSPRAARR